MAHQFLVVDGHSVIFSWPDLRAQHDKLPRVAREVLISGLRGLHDTSEWRVTLIFDGKFGVLDTPDQAGFIVRYADASRTADSLIEALVAAQPETARRQITVITADQAERHVVESLGALCLSPEWLRLELEQQGKAFTRQKYLVNRRAKW